MSRLLQRNLTESFSSPWLPLHEFIRVKFELRVKGGSNAVGTFSVVGSNDPAVADGLWNDPEYAADQGDQTTVTSSFSRSGIALNEPARMVQPAVLVGQTADLPSYVRLVYTWTSGSGAFTCDVDVVERGVDGVLQISDATPPSGSVAGSRFDIRVESYAPNGVLTQENFQAAYEAAYAAALVLSLAPADYPALFRPRYMVRIPEGMWRLSNTLVLPSHAADSPEYLTPGITGSEQYGTMLVVDINDFTPVNNSFISVGGDSGDNYALHPLIENLTLCTVGGVGDGLNGITATLTFGLTIRNVSILGIADTMTRPDRGWGIRLLDTGTSSNNQYPVLDNVRIQGCDGGVYAVNCVPLKINRVFSKQNLRHDHVFSRCTVSIDGGSLESGQAGVNSPYRCTKGLPRVMTGWETEAASGTGAAIGTASGDVTTVTGLSGMTVAADLYRWLYLEKSSGAYDGADKVSGYYLIIEIVSATSVKIRKGSSHSATSSLIWSTHEAGQVDIEIVGCNYHEGECFALVGAYAVTSGAGSIMVGRVNAANCDYAVESLGNSSRAGLSVVIDGARQMSAFVKARYVPQIRALEAPPGTVGDIDEYSREGLLSRGVGSVYASGTTYTYDALGAAIRTSHFPAGRARTMCRLGGAVAIWDARVASSFNKSGADITSWTDVLGGYVASLVNAAKYPQYSAADAVFDNQPSVTFTGNAANANVAAMLATIPAAAWGNTPHTPCIVFVAATPAASALPGSQVCNFYIGQSGLTDLGVKMLEQAANYTGNIYPPGDAQSLAETPTTSARVFVMGGGGRSRPRISSQNGTQVMANYGAYLDKDGWTPGDTLVRFQYLYGVGAGSWSTPFVAVFPNGLSRDARDQLIDQLCLEFGIAR